MPRAWPSSWMTVPSESQPGSSSCRPCAVLPVSPTNDQQPSSGLLWTKMAGDESQALELSLAVELHPPELPTSWKEMHGTARWTCAMARSQRCFTVAPTSEARQYLTTPPVQGLPAAAHCPRSDRPCSSSSWSCDAAFMSPSTQEALSCPHCESMGRWPVTLFTWSRVITAPLCSASFTDMSSSALLRTSMASFVLLRLVSRSLASAATCEPLLTVSTILIASPRASLSLVALEACSGLALVARCVDSACASACTGCPSEPVFCRRASAWSMTLELTAAHSAAPQSSADTSVAPSFRSRSDARNMAGLPAIGAL
mmetsp:Transcript_70435/g.206033  ORF Transcript_70435/g.206033 Transcript_70435/m.206033 type:complete len:314 (+) Transcript_70435:732-1673(+)